MSDLDQAMHFLSEKELQQACMEALRWQGWLVYHTHDSRRSPAGFPDLVAVKGTRTMFVEFKTKTGKISKEQELWLTELSKGNGEVYLVRPANYDQFLQLMAGNFTTEHLECHWNSVVAARKVDET